MYTNWTSGSSTAPKGRLRSGVKYGQESSLAPDPPRRAATHSRFSPSPLELASEGARDQQRTAGVELRDFSRSGRVFFLVEATFFTFQYEQICIFRMEFSLTPPLPETRSELKCLVLLAALSSFMIVYIHGVGKP